MCLVESFYGGNHVCVHKVFWIWFTGVRRLACHWLVSDDIAPRKMDLNGLVGHHLTVVACIGYGIRFVMFLPEFVNIAPSWACVVLQIPSDSVARISQVLSAAALIQFGTSVAGMFSWLVQVIVVRWWMVESLKVLCFYIRSLEIGQCSEHCFTPAWLSYKSWWLLCR